MPRINFFLLFSLPEDILPKLFGPLAQWYSKHPGGYTRVLRIELKDKYDQAPSVILEFVDGVEGVEGREMQG